jgi:iron complex outermembrane receptor protein
MKKICLHSFLCLVGLVLILGGASFATAQDDDDVFMLEAVTVTAQKREENLQKVAITMESVSGSELTEWGSTDVQDALAGVSNAIVQNVGSELNVSIRGLDSDSRPGTSVSMVSVTVDGTYSSSSGVGASGLYDMDRVEVLAGPQGTLYSRNSSGGVVNMVSKNPESEYAASGSIEIGSYNLLNAQGMVNAPVNDKVAVRTAFSTSVRDGYIDNDTDDNDSKGARIKVKYDPTEDISVILGTEMNYTGGKGRGDGVDVFEDEGDTDAWTSEVDGNFYSTERKSFKYYMNLTWDLGGIGEVTFQPAFTKMDSEDLTANESTETESGYEQGYKTETQDEISQELRLASSDDAFLKYIVGLYYYGRDYGAHEWSDSGNAISFRDSEDESMAYFANVTYPVTDTFRLTLGGRYTDDSEDMVISNYEATGMRAGWSTQEEHPGSKHFDYKVGTEYDLSDAVMVWADHSTGYRQAMKDADDPELLTAYQAGMKGRFFGQKLQVNASTFYYDYEDYQVMAMGTRYVGGEAVDDRGMGTGEAELYGVDLSSSFVLSAKDRVDLSASYLKAEISSLEIEYEISGQTEDFSGGRLNNSPEWTLVGSYEHEFSLPNGGSLTARGDIKYVTDYEIAFFLEENAIPDGMTAEAVNYQEAHTITNLALNYGFPSGKMNLNLYVKNLEDYAEKTGFMAGSMKINAPRTIGGVFSIRF